MGQAPCKESICAPTAVARQDARASLEGVFRDAACIIAADFARAITAEEVARRVASSPRQLRRAFSAAAGVGFRAYLTQVRMTRAAQLLAATDLPIKEIGKRVGYHEPSQFTKAFKRAHGGTPSEIRTKHSSLRAAETSRWLLAARSGVPRTCSGSQTGTEERIRRQPGRSGETPTSIRRAERASGVTRKRKADAADDRGI